MTKKADALSGEERLLWRNFLRWSEGITAAVAQELSTQAGLSHVDYEVLIRLSDAGGEQPRQELEQSLSWSPSRLSHQLRRMEARELVRRADAGRGRHVNVALADGGRELLAVAGRVHAEAVRRYLLEPLPSDVREFLGRGPGA